MPPKDVLNCKCGNRFQVPVHDHVPPHTLMVEHCISALILLLCYGMVICPRSVLYLAMSPDGQTIVTGAGDETLRFWSVFPGQRAQGPDTSVSSLARTTIR